MIGGVCLNGIVALPQSLSSTQSGTSFNSLWSVGSGAYRMGYTMSSASYGFYAPSLTATSFALPYGSSSQWWRTGVTYKYFVAKKF